MRAASLPVIVKKTGLKTEAGVMDGHKTMAIKDENGSQQDIKKSSTRRPDNK